MLRFGIHSYYLFIVRSYFGASEKCQNGVCGLLAQVYCEMRADGGWTVFQRRSSANVSFNRNWAAYKIGFGDMARKYLLTVELGD